MKPEQKQTIQILAYYALILLSVGLIWGGGMAFLRGSVLAGLLSILLGIFLQLILKKHDVHRGGLDADDWRDALVGERGDDARREETSPGAELESARVSESRTAHGVRKTARGQGSDGAMLSVNSGSHLRIREDQR